MEQEGIELPSSTAAVRLLMLTGCRLGEIMNLKWEYVDIPGKALRLPDSNTGAKIVHVGQPAVAVLEQIERVDEYPWVIVGAKPGARLADLQPFNVSERAPASRTCVSMICGTHSRRQRLQTVRDFGKLLGHTQVQTTARYAHLAADPIRSAADQVSASIAAALN